MVGKVDVVMWTKNGAAYLPAVLAQIDEVIPKDHVCHKIMVDDHSTDDTPQIAKRFGWTVYPNPHGGIPSGANEALSHVDQEFFVSIEQDVILAKDWWIKISKHLEDPSVACAQGIRVPSSASAGHVAVRRPSKTGIKHQHGQQPFPYRGCAFRRRVPKRMQSVH